MAEKKCDGCGEETSRKKLGRIRGEYFCRKCRSERRQLRRKETIDTAGIEIELKKLDRKIKNESQRKGYRKRNPVKEKIKDTSAPIPKGATSGKIRQKNKSESYLGFQESQILLKILMGRGLDFEEAKDKVRDMKNELKDTRDDLKKKNKSEEEISKKIKLKLEELYNY